MIDLTIDLNEHLLSTLQEFIHVATEDKPDPEEVEFWMDKDTVIYLNSPVDDEIHAATYDDLSEGLGFFEEFITRDFISTYLSTGDLILIICAEDEESRNAQVAVADRATGIALVHPGNLFNSERLSRISDIASDNSINTDDLKPWVSNYRLVTRQGETDDTNTRTLSKNRLVSMLNEIEINALCRYTGKDFRLTNND